MPPKRKATAPPPAATGPAESHTRSKRVRVASAARALLEPDVEKAPEPAVEEAPAPAKRGRKAKAVVEETAAAEPVEAPEVPEPAKRGRRPAAAVENAAEKLEEEEEATTSATASKKTTTKSKTQPIAKAEPKTKAKAKPEPAAETKPKAEPKPKAAKAKADSKPSSVKASPKPKKATTKTATASPGKASIIIATTSSKKSPAKTSPRRVPSPIKTTLAVPRVSKRAALSAGPATADYEADESRPATATATISPGKTKTTKVAAATRGRPKGTAKEKAASPRKAKASTAKASSSVSARGGRARRAAVEIEEDGGEGKEDEEEDEEDDEMDAGERRATPPRLNYGSVHKLAAWRLARDAPATKPARKGRAAAAGKAAKATTIRKRQRDEIAFPLDEGEDDNSSSSPNLHTLSLSDLQSLVASWSADGAHDAESGSGSISTSLIPSGPDHFPQQIATCTSALADIVSTLSSAVLAVQSERHAADALALRYAKFALWHHERVVRLAKRLERELKRVGTAADLKTATKGKGKDGEMRGSEMGEGKLAGAMRLLQRIRDWSDDGAVRCGEACQRGGGSCEECGRAEVLPDPEVEENLPDYEDDEQEDDEEEEDVVIVVEPQLGLQNIEDADVLQAHRAEDESERLDPAYAYGQIAALQSAFGGSVPVQPIAARPASARSVLSTNGGHRPAAITTASLPYAQPSVVTAPLTSQSQLRPASMNSNLNPPAPAPAPAKSALLELKEVISPTSPPYSSRDVDGEVGDCLLYTSPSPRD